MKDSKTVTPYGESNKTKKQEVAEMFNNIASKYDFLNHFLSMGIDILWRKKAIRILKKENPQIILDVATGTGDFAIEAVATDAKKIIGVDIARDMFKIGEQKVAKKNLSHIISFDYGDSENLQFDDNHFDAITVSFGVRNFENLNKGLAEMNRVLKPGGSLVVIEFSKPTTFPIKQLYNFYFKFILPTLGKLISKDQRAYTYLPESVEAFPFGQVFLDKMLSVNFRDVKNIPLTFGIASIYIGKK
jgi:demethylmenaquinone methyltransferase / 2-methoxy-6-polyprenyl-1,4-benzoquinol methylase|tara:strand:+ start:1180 stop:1914 length:735 start_codon:yes stop_codon:yes gene_type:complete